MIIAFSAVYMISAAGQSRQQPSAGNQTPTADQRPAQDERGTQQHPLAVNVVPTEEQKKETAEQAIEAQAKTRRDEKLVDYTGDLVLVGIVQFGVFILQLIAFTVQAVYLRKSAVEMHETTAAAKNASDDQITHAHQVERAYISGGGAREAGERILSRMEAAEQGVPEVQTVWTENFVLAVNNYGKTPGELLRYGIGFCEADSISEVPQYAMVDYRDWYGPDTRSRQIARYGIPKLKRPLVYGRFFYRDIFGGTHSSGFINRLYPFGESVPVLAPRAYTEERDEPQ